MLWVFYISRGAMTKKCITLNDITYKDKWHKVDTIIFVEDKDVKKLVMQGAVRSLEKPKVKLILHHAIEEIKEIKEIEFKPKKKRVYKRKKRIMKKEI